MGAMSPLRSLYDEVIFRLADISAAEMLDLLLVTVVLYLLLNLIQRSRSVVLLRGTLTLIVFFFIVSVMLPLPAFNRLVQIALGAVLVATPIIFQPELRRLLERLGRSTGLVRAVRQTTAETVARCRFPAAAPPWCQESSHDRSHRPGRRSRGRPGCLDRRL
jgi:hypothetical protein